jgi:hypothetical protein
LNTSSYVIADVDGGGIPLESPRRFMTRYLPRLAVGMWDRLCVAIRLLFLGSAGGGRLSVAESCPSSSRSGGCLAFVIHSLKLLRLQAAESV